MFWNALHRTPCLYINQDMHRVNAVHSLSLVHRVSALDMRHHQGLFHVFSLRSTRTFQWFEVCWTQAKNIEVSLMMAPIEFQNVLDYEIDEWIKIIKCTKGSRNGVVGIATCYGLECPGIESQRGRDFPHISRTAPRSIQPPVEWVPGPSRG